MDNLDYLKSSPALQLSKQFDTQHAVAQRIASHFDGILNSGAVATAMKVAHKDWMTDISSVAENYRSAFQTWKCEATAAAKAIVASHMNRTRENASMVLGLEASHMAWAFKDSPTQRIIETIKRDWDPIAEAVKSAQEKCALEIGNFAKITDLWRKDLARESSSWATTLNSVPAAWTFDTTRSFRTFEPTAMPKISLEPAWVAPVFLERLEPSRAPQVTPSNILARRPFTNYRMAESYDLLSDFERDMRDFIYRAMCEAFGMGWEKSRLPSGMYEEWVEKRQKARTAGESSERLIDYADFTDYVDIISRKDNWKEVFRSRLERRESVQESLHRLHSVRLCTMHSRILPHKLWQVLQTETLLLRDKMWN